MQNMDKDIVPNQAIATYVTQWAYDSHNRLLEMIYPDEEKVSYTYDLGGQLTNVHGYKSYGYDYVNRIGYDKFGQRTYMKYCNGAETFYTYEPQRRRLQGLKVDAGGRTIMDNAYTYDAVSNVLGVTNGAALPQSGKAGGQMSHSYTYDALYRLSSATGTYTGADSKTASYTLAMGYDNMHRITSKSQHLTQGNLQFDGTLNVGYDLTYTYGQEDGKKFQLDNVSDVNYRTETTPDESRKTRNSHAYEYDANGNLVYVNTGRTKKDGTTDEKAHERKLKWDEENRLLASDDDGFVTNYWYDADGERTVKTSGESEQVYVNSEFAGGRTNTAKFSLYVSPYLVANQGGRYTKHIYIGSQRIVSKIGDFESYGADPRRIEYAGKEADAVNVDYDVKYSQQLQTIKENYATFGVPYNGTDNNDYVNGDGFCCDDGSMEAAHTRAMAKALENNFQEGDAYENLQFYYHSDHLGSSSYITNLDGAVVQHIEYVPFGEVFIEERNNIWNTPYLFNAKEFDEETGLYYYGARYYDPRLSLWMSADPLEEDYPNIITYAYCHNNPIKHIDPDGLSTWVVEVGKGKYKVIGGNLNDKDLNIYLYSKDENGKYTIRGNSIGKTPVISSFYNSDADKGKGSWAIGNIIDTNDKSGMEFIEAVKDTKLSLPKYIYYARNFKKYDFKSTNGTDEVQFGPEKYYRGMPIKTPNGHTLYTSARDIGNMMAGYKAGASGLKWAHVEWAFDAYQSRSFTNITQHEGFSTRNAEKYGYMLGRHTLPNHGRDNKINFSTLINSLFGY